MDMLIEVKPKMEVATQFGRTPLLIKNNQMELDHGYKRIGH